MPIYEYRCKKCGSHFEKRQSVSEDPLKVCEHCEGELARLGERPATERDTRSRETGSGVVLGVLLGRCHEVLGRRLVELVRHQVGPPAGDHRRPGPAEEAAPVSGRVHPQRRACRLDPVERAQGISPDDFVKAQDPITGEMCAVEGPVEYQIVRRQRQITPAERVSEPVAAVTRTVRQRRLVTPAETRWVNVPERTVMRRVRQLVEPERQISVPVPAVYEILEKSSSDLKVQTDKLQQVLATDLAGFNAAAIKAGVEPVK